MDGFVKVGTVSEFREGRGRSVRFGDRHVAVFRTGGAWYALQDGCPHQGASLADGQLDGDDVICLRHDWRFDLGSGRSSHRSGACAKAYDVRVEGDDVLVAARPETKPVEPTEDEEWVRWDPDRFFKSGP